MSATPDSRPSHQPANAWAEILLCLKVFYGHYRRAPMQAGAILTGILLSVVLLTAVKSINENARASYRDATAPLSGRAAFTLLPANGRGYLKDELYFQLRREGLTLQPRLSGSVVFDSNGSLDDGRSFYIDGVDVIAALQLGLGQDADQAANKETSLPALPEDIGLGALLTGEPILLVSQASLQRLKGGLKIKGAPVSLIALDDSYNLGSAMVADLSFAKTLLGEPDSLSAIEVLDNLSLDEFKQRLIRAGLDPEALEIRANDGGDSLTRLTASFHLSLKAMGMLAFVVGLFIAYNGVRYSLMKRTRLLLQLRQLGVGQKALLWALMTELWLMVILGSMAGFVAGLWLGQSLMPLVAMTLEQIYGARLLPGQWQASWFIEAFSLCTLASLFACIPLMARLVSSPLASGRQQAAELGFDIRMQRLQSGAALLLLTAAALLTLMEPQLIEDSTSHFRSLYTLGLIGLVTLAAPLLLPGLLARLPGLLRFAAKPGLGQYLVNELKQLAPPMSLAMMAMLLALGANIAMTTLVVSFEGTLRAWLNNRLHADIYLRPGDSRMQEVMTALSQDSRINTLYRQYQSPALLQIGLSDKDAATDATAGLPIKLIARDRASIAQSTTLKTSDKALWQAMETGDGPLLLVNEPMALKLGLKPGQSLRLHIANQTRTFMLAGIYYDHGNQSLEAVIQESLWQKLGLSPTPLSLAIDCKGCDAGRLATELAASLRLSRSQVYSQQHIRELALSLFGRTFDITASLGTLTLLVAAIGLFSALSMLSASREAALSRLHALGVSRSALFLMSAVQLLLMVLATAILAIPVAWLLAWLLIHKVILLSFGWSLTMDWQWLPVLMAIATAIFAASLALIWPLWRQSRRPLIRSLQQEVM